MDQVLSLLFPGQGRLEQGGFIQYGLEGFLYAVGIGPGLLGLAGRVPVGCGFAG